MENKPILIIAGGTGGHVMPALAVALALREKGIPVHWMGTPKGIETHIINPYHIPFHPIKINSLRKKSVIGWIKAPFQITKAIIQAIHIIRRVRPQAVLSMGGYVSGPGSVAAWLCGYPLLIHEQNAIPGLTNRLLAPIANGIMTGFPEVFPKQTHKSLYTGNPVRSNITPKTASLEAIRPLRLLILGGSLGASVLNHTLPQAIEGLAESLRPDIWHQTGEKQQKETLQAYQQARIHAKVDAFIQNMSSAYEWADAVICRAGALTVAELAMVGLPSILIPFPGAVDDHQTKNAHYLTKQGAALLLPQSQLTPSILTRVLTDFLRDRNQLKEQGLKARQLAHFNATTQVVHYLLKTIKKVHPCTT